MDLMIVDEDEMRRKVNLDFVGFVVSGAGTFVIIFLMFWLFGYVAAKVTHNLRGKLYNHIFTMDVGWFDLPTNLPSSINTVLAEGTENINGVVRLVAGTTLQSLSALVVALASASASPGKWPSSSSAASPS